MLSTMTAIDAGCGRVTSEPGQRRPVGRRVGDDDVVAGAAGGQPECLGQGVGQDAAEAVHLQRPARSGGGSAPTCWPAGSACRAARLVMAAAFARNAAMSTIANGASRCAVAGVKPAQVVRAAATAHSSSLVRAAYSAAESRPGGTSLSVSSSWTLNSQPAP